MSIWLNGVDLARELNITKGRVSQLKKEGVFRLGLNKLFDLDECRKNFKEYRSNATPQLPLSGTESIKRFKDDVAAERGAALSPAITSHHETLVKAKALRETYRAQIEKKLLDETDGRLIDKNIYNAALGAIAFKNNALIKAKLISIPKRLALGWPDPKKRAQIETMANEYINDILTEMAEINPAKTEDEIKHKHDEF